MPARSRSIVREILPEQDWRARQNAHIARLRRWTKPQRERMARGERHAVHDFLFEYYSWRPSLLERWHPGIGIALAGGSARPFLAFSNYEETPEGIAAGVAALAAHRVDSVRWIASLLRTCAERPAFFGCFGMHEWAMVYRTDDVRHAKVPLRFPPDEIARIVETLGVRCSHFDAFRFFTPAARPLNRHQPAHDTRLELEQRGCVHVTMDLYKWAIKLTPFAPGELLGDTFELAVAARELDMRASPYDVRAFGFEPVKVETPEGRVEYEREQRALAERAAPLRVRLLGVCEQVLAAATR